MNSHPLETRALKVVTHSEHLLLELGIDLLYLDSTFNYVIVSCCSLYIAHGIVPLPFVHLYNVSFVTSI